MVLVLLGAMVLGGPACRKDQGEAALHARQSALEREASGLRESVARLERGEPILPQDAVVLSVSEAVVKQFIDAQLPFEAETDKFKVKLTKGEAVFRGSPSVHLIGSIWHVEHPDLVGEVSAQGALATIEVEPESGVLKATLALDHVDFVQLAGLENYIPDASRNELARRVRKELEPRLPPIRIPVKIDQAVDLPTVTDGPVRIQGARMPLSVEMAGVFAGQGVLWVAIRVVPGELSRPELSPSAPAAGSKPPTRSATASPKPSPSAKASASPKASPSPAADGAK
jgi:hypothetical protein